MVQFVAKKVSKASSCLIMGDNSHSIRNTIEYKWKRILGLVQKNHKENGQNGRNIKIFLSNSDEKEGKSQPLKSSTTSFSTEDNEGNLLQKLTAN